MGKRLTVSYASRIHSPNDFRRSDPEEGNSARIYFQSFRYLMRDRIREEFAFEARTRRPPLDPINALLSFLYAILLNDCRSAVEGVGLDPQLGFLHAVRPGRMALALDILGRVPFGDRRSASVDIDQPGADPSQAFR